MKKYLISLIVLSVLILPVLAAADTTSGGSGVGGTPSGTTDLPGLITGIKQMAWMVFGVIAVIAFVIAGVLFLTAAGNPEKVQQARNAFLWGVAGVIVGILAFSIISIIQTGIPVLR